MKKSIPYFVAAAVCAGAFQAACAAEIKTLNGIAMEVNGSIITHGDVARTAELMAGAAPAEAKKAGTQALLQAARASLLERELVVSAARSQDMKVQPQEVDNALAQRARRAGVSVKKLYEDAAAFGMSAKQFRADAAKDLLAERVLAGINEGIKVGDKEISAYLREGKPVPEAKPYTVYQIQRIVLGINQTNTAVSVGQRMKAIADAVRNGGDMAVLARRYSQEHAAGAGGVLEVNEFSQPEKVEALLQTLRPGQLAEPVQTASGWQLVRLLDKRTETDPEKIRREAVRRVVWAQERDKAHQKFLEELQHNAVVREY